MSWNYVSIQPNSYDNIEEFYADDLKYSWGRKFSILDNKLVGKKKGKLYELIKDNETNEVFANLTIIEIGELEVSYKTIGLDHSIPASFVKQMSPKYQAEFDKLKKVHKDKKENEKKKKEQIKNLKLDAIVEMKTGHIVKFKGNYSTRKFMGQLNESQDETIYGWDYKDVLNIA